MEVNGTGGWGTISPDAFMRLFVTQMQHQDPTQPMDTNQMMAQLTQLATVQQLDSLSTDFANAFRTEQLSLARDLIGATVRYYAGGSIYAGEVSEAGIENDVVGVTVNETFVSLDKIRGILASANAAEPVQ